jgi:hypothetical protein
MERQIKLALVPTAERNSCGPRASRNSIAKSVSPIRPNGASSAAPSASSEILRACDVLRAVLLRNDEELSDTEPDPVVGQVADGISEIIDRLQSYAGLQMMFEAWNRS